jgi:hypothetical protein
MKIPQLTWILAFFLAPPCVSGKQSTNSPSPIHTEILQVYNFQPHTLSKDQRAASSARLDQFWAKAKADQSIYVPALRRELADYSNPPFFLFDGSNLLLSLSDDPSDRKIVLGAVAHTDLRDVAPQSYFYLVHQMAVAGEDTTSAAFHILDDPKFEVYVPQHDLRLGQDACLLYLLLSTDQNDWLHPALSLLQQESDPTAQQSLLLLLWYAQTPESDNAILNFSIDMAKPESSRSYANELVHRKDSLPESVRKEAAKTSETRLREDRRNRMKSVSDEALDDMDSYTAQIMAIREK